MPTPLTICVANVQSGVCNTKGFLEYPFVMWKYWLPHSNAPLIKAGEMMKRENVDLSFLIEVSGPSLQSGYRNQNDVIANSAGLGERQFFTMKEPKRLAQEGLGIISHFPLPNHKIHPLSRGILTWYLGESCIEINGKKITLFIAHLALGSKVRAKQFKEIAGILKSVKGPIILAGDFNEPTDAPFEMLQRETSLKHSCSAKTFPSWKPRYQFDRILLSQEFRVIDQYVPQGELISDHLPFIVKAELV